jgi:hypothetical protein
MNRRNGRRLRRVAYGALGIGLAALAVWQVVGRGTGLWHVAAFAVAPDLPLLFGGTKERGRISRRAVRLYNATHRFWGPVAIAVASLGLGTAWLAGASAWEGTSPSTGACGSTFEHPMGFREWNPPGRGRCFGLWPASSLRRSPPAQPTRSWPAGAIRNATLPRAG